MQFLQNPPKAFLEKSPVQIARENHTEDPGKQLGFSNTLPGSVSDQPYDFYY
jgi:hypothetical protein